MSFRCFYYPPEPGYYSHSHAAAPQPEPFPEYQPDAPPPVESDAPARYYPEYLSNMYLAESHDDLWERMNDREYIGERDAGPAWDSMGEIDPFAPPLKVLPTRYTPVWPPWKGRTARTTNESAKATPRDTVANPEYTRVSPPRCDDDYMVRPVAARVTHELKELCFLFGRHNSAEIEDFVDQMGTAYRLLRRMVRQRRKALKEAPKQKPGDGQLSLV